MPQKTELEERVRGFNAELLSLLSKYRLGLGAQSFLSPDGRVLARLTLIDDTKTEKAEDLQPPKAELSEA